MASSTSVHSLALRIASVLAMLELSSKSIGFESAPPHCQG